ncbi:hypothetical protein EJ07DRAFT_82125, partial [Lizonia empirigonia]
TRSELALVQDSVKENDDRPLFSGRPLRPENVDIELAKRWLHVCRTQHGSACEIPAHDATTAVPDSTPRDLLVIDVQELKLCALPETEQHIALSYCWPYGAETTFLTTKAVYKDLLKPGGLEERLTSLTAVVRDAISFLREFGQRYLWVDALCIIQDDLEYKMSQIQQMDLVYGAALMTIILTYPIQAIHTYRMLHYQYSDRNMTNPGDVVFAFQGVITILSRTLQTDFIAGLPERYFHGALLWISMGEFALRSVHKEDVKKVFPYPSWTWAGWRSRTTYNLVFTALGMGDDDTYLDGETEWFLTDSAAVWKLDTPIMHDITREKWGNRVSTLDAGPVPTNLVLDNGFWNSSLQLASWTRTAQFRITGDSYPLNGYGGRDSWATKNVTIFGRDGKAAGSILLRKEAIQHLLSEGDVHDFVLLSRSLQLTKLISFFDEDIFPRRDWCHVSVMLVGEGRERDLGAVGRFGVGVVHEDAWGAAQPNPKWV